MKKKTDEELKAIQDQEKQNYIDTQNRIADKKVK